MSISLPITRIRYVAHACSKQSVQLLQLLPAAAAGMMREATARLVCSTCAIHAPCLYAHTHIGLTRVQFVANPFLGISFMDDRASSAGGSRRGPRPSSSARSRPGSVADSSGMEVPAVSGLGKLDESGGEAAASSS